MEVTFTLTIGITFVALLATFMILLKGTRNFAYRTIGLVCFFILLGTITFGYLDLMGKPKPLHYESWFMEEGEKGESEGKDSSESSGQEGQPGQDGAGQIGKVLEMDIIEWEHDPAKEEAYLWMRKDRKPDQENQPTMNYSFDTSTESGQQLLKSLQEADAEAQRRGLQRRGRGSSGIRMRILIDRLLMADDERFKFFVPPPKLLLPKTIPPPGTYFPNTTGANPNARPVPALESRNRVQQQRITQPTVQPPVVQSPVMRPEEFQR